jgi:hypothetical protein
MMVCDVRNSATCIPYITVWKATSFFPITFLFRLCPSLPGHWPTSAGVVWEDGSFSIAVEHAGRMDHLALLWNTLGGWITKHCCGTRWEDGSLSIAVEHAGSCRHFHFLSLQENRSQYKEIKKRETFKRPEKIKPAVRAYHGVCLLLLLLLLLLLVFQTCQMQNILNSGTICNYLVQNLWSFFFTPLVLYGHKSWFLILLKEHKLKVLGNRVLRKISWL